MAAILTTEVRRGSEAFAAVANNLVAVEIEMKKMGIGVHWAFQVAEACTAFMSQIMLILFV